MVKLVLFHNISVATDDQSIRVRQVPLEVVKGVLYDICWPKHRDSWLNPYFWPCFLAKCSLSHFGSSLFFADVLFPNWDKDGNEAWFALEGARKIIRCIPNHTPNLCKIHLSAVMEAELSLHHTEYLEDHLVLRLSKPEEGEDAAVHLSLFWKPQEKGEKREIANLVLSKNGATAQIGDMIFENAGILLASFHDDGWPTALVYFAVGNKKLLYAESEAGG